MKTDFEIQRDVLAELEWDPAVNAAQVGVDVENGIVTLSGHLASYAEKCNAQLAAQRVRGVRGLAVALDVAPAGVGKRTDEDIARAAEVSLRWTSFLAEAHLQVMVDKGWLTLTGEVDQPYQRKAAELAVRDLVGVADVSNNITLRSRTASETVKSDIEAALTRRSPTDAKTIWVAVEGSRVTLSGSVSRLSDRDMAAKIAWSATGVHRVVDNIDVR